MDDWMHIRLTNVKKRAGWNVGDLRKMRLGYNPKTGRNYVVGDSYNSPWVIGTVEKIETEKIEES